MEGSSLAEQQAAIEAFAQRHNFVIGQWFEEQKTAAKHGRPVFTQMLTMLKKKKADGVIMHKIDRASRNHHDWADLGELLEGGTDVHFVNESLDLRSRGGRLAADIQAVVAADYIRNLRDEVRKGIDGRLKQGLYPFRAPIGYLDTGGGKAKVVDPVKGPLVRLAFQLYATGEYNLDMLLAEMRSRGLCSYVGTPMSLNALSRLLNNPFYCGIIFVRGRSYSGVHQPIVPKRLYDEVQYVLRTNRLVGSGPVNTFQYQRMIRCCHCARMLVGERQKQRYIYYRCHNKLCPSVCVSEKEIDRVLEATFACLQFQEDERREVQDLMDVVEINKQREQKEGVSAYKFQLGQIKDRLSRLTDLLVDGAIDKTAYDERRSALIGDQKIAEQAVATIGQHPTRREELQEMFELANSAYLLIKWGNREERRNILSQASSNFLGEGNQPLITLRNPLNALLQYRKSIECEPRRGNARTRAKRIFEILSADDVPVERPGSPDVLRRAAPGCGAAASKAAPKKSQDAEAVA